MYIDSWKVKGDVWKENNEQTRIKEKKQDILFLCEWKGREGKGYSIVYIYMYLLGEIKGKHLLLIHLRFLIILLNYAHGT